MRRTHTFASLVLLLAALGQTAAAPKPLKVFVLAGQSNMEGQGVADLDGKDYNDGKGTLVQLLRDPAAEERRRPNAEGCAKPEPEIGPIINGRGGREPGIMTIL